MVVHKGQEFYYAEESPTTLEFSIYDRKKNKVMVKFNEPLPIQKRKVKVWFGKHSQAFYFQLNTQPRMADSEDVFYRIKLRYKGKESLLWVRVVEVKDGCAQPVIKEL